MNCLKVCLIVCFPTLLTAFPGLGLFAAMDAPDEEKLFFNEQIPEARTVVTEGLSTTLHCSAGGSPSPSIHWLKDGVRIAQSMSNLISDDEAVYETIGIRSDQPTLRLAGTKSRLFIDCASAREAGTYTCVAETPTLRISTNTDLLVDDSSPHHVEQCIKKRLLGGKPARIFMWTVQRLEFEGADVQLFCRASGTPLPRITWYDKQGQEITTNDNQYTLLDNGDLLIRGVSWENNMGSYRCGANNGHGRDEVSIFLYPTFP
jgi:hypothetical protein